MNAKLLSLPKDPLLKHLHVQRQSGMLTELILRLRLHWFRRVNQTVSRIVRR
jgi:hypothetical protein